MSFIAAFRRTPWRHAVPFCMAAWVFGGSFYAVATKGEPWPFSFYGMYAPITRSHNGWWTRVYGVNATGAEIQFADEAWIAPFDIAELQVGLQNIRLMQDPVRLHAALSDVLARYDARRRLHLVDGPALIALRFYGESWHYELDDDRMPEPQTRTVIAEAKLGELASWPP